VRDLNDRDMGNGLKLYVKAALSKDERQAEKEREKLRYKNSKKRCNLYVKNFPAETNEQQLRELFSPFG
jgi:RNA recognition motif-containing protein